MSRDPVLGYVVQPVVDRLGIDPRTAAATAANLFLTMTITLAATRVATLDPSIRPGLYLSQTMGVVGAAIGYACLRFSIANGEGTLLGLPGVIHLGARVMYLACLAIDLREVHMLATTDLHVPAMSMMRSCMQLTQTAAFLLALYLSVSRRPPPPKRRASRLAHAGI